MLNLSPLDPEAGCAARIVAGHRIYALPQQFGNQHASAHLFQKRGEVQSNPILKNEVVVAPGVSSGAHSKFARGVTAEKITLHHTVLDNVSLMRGHAFVIERLTG